MREVSKGSRVPLFVSGACRFGFVGYAKAVDPGQTGSADAAIAGDVELCRKWHGKPVVSIVAGSLAVIAAALRATGRPVIH